MESDLDSGSFINKAAISQISFVDLIDRYLKEVSPRKRGGSMERGKLAPYRRHPLFLRPVVAITAQDAAEVRDWRIGQVSSGTVLREFSILRHVLETARKEWFLPVDNFVRGIRLPSPNPARDRRLRNGELELLLKGAEHYGGAMRWVIQWQIETGMRREETASLKETDIDRVSGVALVKTSKNGGARYIPLSICALAASQAARERHGESLFNMRPMSITQAFKRICDRAGIMDLTLHDLRHEATSRFVEMGFSMAEVMAITGHKDPRMMLRYYQPDAKKLRERLLGLAS